MNGPEQHRYLIALGSNRRDRRQGDPSSVVRGALNRIAELSRPSAVSQIIRSIPIGPSRRRFANAAAVIGTDLAPLALLGQLKAIERAFGRRPGQRWGERVLDLDIILWCGGRFHSSRLTIPHPSFRQRTFVLGPAASIAPGWRDPATGLTLRQLARRLSAPKPLDRGRRAL